MGNITEYANSLLIDSSGMDFRSMLKKKKYAKWGNDDQGPDWGDLKHHDQPEEPELQKVKEVGKLGRSSSNIAGILSARFS